MSLIHLVIGTRNTGKTDYTKINVVEPCLLPKTLIVDMFDNPRWRTSEDYRHKDPLLSSTVNPIYTIHPITLDQVKTQRSGVYRIFEADIDTIFEVIETSVTYTNIIFEDATRFFSSTITKEMQKIIVDCKQKKNNLTFVFHSLAAVPPKILRLADVISLARTGESKPPSKFDHIPNLKETMDYLKQQPDPHKFIGIQIT